MGERVIGWCAQCGPRERVDEDGCCLNCGADSCGEGADAAIAQMRQLAEARALLIRCAGSWCYEVAAVCEDADARIADLERQLAEARARNDRLNSYVHDLVGEEMLHQDGLYETEMCHIRTQLAEARAEIDRLRRTAKGWRVLSTEEPTDG